MASPHPVGVTAAVPARQVAVIGDSLSTGYGTSPETAWPHLIAANTGGRAGSLHVDMVNAARNGSGYVSVGDGGATFGSEVRTAVGPETREIIFFGSENDMGSDPGQLRQAAADAFADARALAPHASLVVVGPPSYVPSPEPTRLNVRDQVRTAALDAGARFIDPISDKWIMGDADRLIGPDGDHPSEQGQHYLQAKMEDIIAETI